MSTTQGNARQIRVTDPNGNVYIMTPVDSEARQAIQEAELLQFDESYFTAEETESGAIVGLNGVPLGVDTDTPIRIVQDTAEGIVFGSLAPFSSAIAPDYDPTATYSKGDARMHLGIRYEANTDISVAEDFTPAHWTESPLSSMGGVIFATYGVTAYSTVSDAYDTGKEIVLVVPVNSIGNTVPLFASLSSKNPSTGSIIFVNIRGDTYSSFSVATDSTWSNVQMYYAQRGLNLLTPAGGSGLSQYMFSTNNSCVRFSSSIDNATFDIVYQGTDVPNFCVELTVASNCTVGVYQQADAQSQAVALNKASSANSALEAGKFYQITAAGSCWTVAEFDVPTP